LIASREGGGHEAYASEEDSFPIFKMTRSYPLASMFGADVSDTGGDELLSLSGAGTRAAAAAAVASLKTVGDDTRWVWHLGFVF
jgi:hypothetical protein